MTGKARPKQVLVVDDSIIVRQLLTLFLLKYIHCEITEAKDGVEALEKLSREKFDLVVTDLNMPRMHGLALVKAVRERHGSSLPIIIVTTVGSEKDRDHGLSLGADAYVTKPVRAVNFIEKALQLLARESLENKDP